MQLNANIQAFVLHFGEMGSRWGFNRTVGQLLALIVANQDPQCADDLISALGVSRGNVSMGLKELQSWRLIRPVHIPGDRKEYYSAAGDLWTLAIRVLEERRKRELDPTLSLLRDLLMDAESGESDPFAKQQMQSLHDMLELVANWSSDLQSMNQETLLKLMKLGAGVGKVIDAKNRLLKK